MGSDPEEMLMNMIFCWGCRALRLYRLMMGKHTCAYEDTESYKVTEMFINHREQLLGRLLLYSQMLKSAAGY